MMMKYSVPMAVAALLCAGCASASQDEAAGDVIIGRTERTAPDGRLTPEILQELGNVGGLAASPDGQRLLYGVTYTSVAENRSNRELFVLTRSADGAEWSAPVAVTHTPKSESQAVWRDDATILFLTGGQVWAMDADGTNRRQLSHTERPIEGFKLSPDGEHILLVMTMPLAAPGDHAQSTVAQAGGADLADLYEGLDKASGVVYDDLMYRHWDDFVRNVPHPFLASFAPDGTIAPEGMTDILEGEPYECPMRPFAGVESFAFTPGGESLIYVCRKKTGRDYAFSTCSALYLYNVRTRETHCLTPGDHGYDTAPLLSPDGTRVAWQSMERDGYESDKVRLLVARLGQEDGHPALLDVEDWTRAFDNNCDAFLWASDSAIVMTSCVEATERIFLATSAAVRQLSPDEDADYAALALVGGELVATKHSMSAPNDIYALGPVPSAEALAQNGPVPASAIKRLTAENEHILGQVRMGRVEKRWLTTTTGEQMLTWVAYPADFDPARQWPTLLYCQGGPQSPVSQFWSTRWNVQMMTAQGYVVVLPNRHGVPGFGQAWNEQISGDYPGQCMRDYLTAIDAIAAEPWCDRKHLGAVGASFGGYSVFWLAGHHEGRFSCFIAHAGIFNMESMWGETEENWFSNWDFGGAYYDTRNARAQRTYALSPHKAVADWDTPILVIHGEKDYRIPVTQGMQAFNIARMRGLDAELLYFPDECHWVQQPQNGVLWQRVFFRWLDKWLKE